MIIFDVDVDREFELRQHRSQLTNIFRNDVAETSSNYFSSSSSSSSLLLTAGSAFVHNLLCSIDIVKEKSMCFQLEIEVP